MSDDNFLLLKMVIRHFRKGERELSVEKFIEYAELCGFDTKGEGKDGS
jgi:hypothetical protein